MSERSRLDWQCRRGMRELDILLRDFLDNSYDSLDEQELAGMETLLSYPDNILLDWLMGRRLPNDKGVAHIVQRIRTAS